MAKAIARMYAGTDRSAESSVLIGQPHIERLERALRAHLVQDRAALAHRAAHRVRVRPGDDHAPAPSALASSPRSRNAESNPASGDRSLIRRASRSLQPLPRRPAAHG